ncbi:MAG: NAD(P)/FAD-dependent oxidoreductase [Tannerella sp.]|jgi:phytoene dehydrogenase-like protein|nr:NAD(P)/FAD-dependent oxidoreductase [Tannerella sp.]
MMSRKVFVIGTGVSGLVAGIYARLAGLDVEMFEAHSMVGGNCTGWNRNGFHIDGCIQWLTGTKPGTGLNKIWRTCGALGDDVSVYYTEKIASAVYEGKTYHLYSDLEKMEAELLSISPGDRVAVKKLSRDIRRFQNLNVPINKPFEQMNLFDILPLVWKLVRSGKPEKKTETMTIDDYLEEFKSPVIRHLLSCVFPTVMPVYTMFYSLGIRTSGDGGWPVGGSLEFVKRMQRRFESLGGRIHLGKEVERIIVKDGKAAGIKLKADDREEIPADYVITAVDADMLLNRLLGGRYHDRFFEERFAELHNYMLLSGTYVGLSIHADLGAYPHNIYVRPEKPIRINATELSFFNVKLYSYDPKFIRDGKTVMTVLLTENEFDYWKALKGRSIEEYKAEKERIAGWVIGGIVKVFPELEGKIEALDVATPLTYNKYCNSYRGTYMSFIPYGHVRKRIHKGTIDGIENLYIAGQCTFPAGGLSLAALSGKFAAQRLLKAEGMNSVGFPATGKKRNGR